MSSLSSLDYMDDDKLLIMTMMTMIMVLMAMLRMMMMRMMKFQVKEVVLEEDVECGCHCAGISPNHCKGHFDEVVMLMVAMVIMVAMVMMMVMLVGMVTMSTVIPSNHTAKDMLMR